MQDLSALHAGGVLEWRADDAGDDQLVAVAVDGPGDHSPDQPDTGCSSLRLAHAQNPIGHSAQLTTRPLALLPPTCRCPNPYSAQGTGHNQTLDAPPTVSHMPCLTHVLHGVWVSCAHCPGSECATSTRMRHPPSDACPRGTAQQLIRSPGPCRSHVRLASDKVYRRILRVRHRLHHPDTLPEHHQPDLCSRSFPAGSMT